MRREDIDALRKPYPLQDGRRFDVHFAESIGVGIPSARDLEGEIFGDLDENKYGIGWWAPHPDPARRILIGDQLLQCVVSIEVNLIEAKLHLLEVQDCWERFSDFLADSVRIDRGRLVVDLPPRTSAHDELAEKLAALHVAGFLRAVASAADCLGGAIIGVLALSASILRSDLEVARRDLRRIQASGAGARLQIDFRDGLEARIAAAGPTGWLAWTLQYRNMFVHRGRRLALSTFKPRSYLYGPDGRPIPRVREATQLARDPGRSDIEMFLDMTRPPVFSSTAVPPVLEEEAEITLRGVLDSMLDLVTDSTERLKECWQHRRADPSMLEQPAEQWKHVPSSDLGAFQGYRPGDTPFSPTALVTSDVLHKRMAAASLLNTTRTNWTTF